MIPELGDNLSCCWKHQQKITYYRTLLPDPAMNTGVSGMWNSRDEKETNVCHGPTREKTTTSNLQKHRLGKTRMLFPRGEPCAQYCDLSTDPEERATVAVSLITDSLWRSISPANLTMKLEYKRFSSPAASTDRRMAAFLSFISSHTHDQECVDDQRKCI